jgi:uncharacterized repeat protein (TIGR02543 family)
LPPVTAHTVTFSADGRSVTVTVADGESVTVPFSPEKAGYTFTAWKLNGAAYDFNSAVVGDFTLTAEFTAAPAAPVPVPPDSDVVPLFTDYWYLFASGGGLAGLLFVLFAVKRKKRNG